MDFPKLETFLPEMFNGGWLFFAIDHSIKASEINHILSPKRKWSVAKMFSETTENLKMDKIIHF